MFKTREKKIAKSARSLFSDSEICRPEATSFNFNKYKSYRKMPPGHPPQHNRTHTSNVAIINNNIQFHLSAKLASDEMCGNPLCASKTDKQNNK